MNYRGGRWIIYCNAILSRNYLNTGDVIMENKLDKQLQFIEMRAKGNSFDRIAKKLKVNKKTLIEWSKVNHKEIRMLANLEKDALFESYKINREHQIKSLGSQLTKIREEINKRDLSSISTEKLINLEMRLSDSVNKLREPVILYSDDQLWDIEMENSWEG